MDAMASRLEKLLVAAQEKAAPLSFVVFVPGWEECECWKALKSSQFLRGELLVAAADHGYCDGASHQRNDSFRVSCYDSGKYAAACGGGIPCPLRGACFLLAWLISTKGLFTTEGRCCCRDLSSPGVFILQTEAASRKWAVSEDLLNDLRLAMAMSTPTEAVAKRQKRSK